MDGIHEYFVFLHPCMQEDRQFILSFSGDERVEVSSRQFKNTKICAAQSL
jgi:hypothetical protein